MLVLLVGLLVLLHPGSVEASSTGGGSSFELPFRCSCGGNYLEYYNVPNIYRWRSITHSIYNAEMYNNCSLVDFGRSANGDKCYFVKLFSGSDLFDYYSFVIYVSEDDIIELYDNVGNVINRNKFDFNNGLNFGESNGKYFGFIGNIEGYGSSFTHHYDDGYNYSITVPSYSTSKIVELARFLCGEFTDLPDGYEIIQPEAIYDLEAPLGVTVSSSDNSRNFQIYGDGLYQGSDLVIPYKVWWNQSNIDLSGYETEFYVREYGKYKKSLFSSWVDVMTPYIFDKSFVTAKYCNNSLKYYEFSPKVKKRIYSYCQDVAGEEPYAVEFYHPDFMLRNKKEDENGQMHYSNWVYVKTYDDGTYSVFEMEQEYDLEEDPDETGNIDVDSPNYDDEIIYEDTDYSPDIGGVKDSAKFITVLKDLANSLGDFPDLFAQIFSFLPSWVLVCIGTLFVVIMLKGIF